MAVDQVLERKAVGRFSFSLQTQRFITCTWKAIAIIPCEMHRRYRYLSSRVLLGWLRGLLAIWSKGTLGIGVCISNYSGPIFVPCMVIAWLKYYPINIPVVVGQPMLVTNGCHWELGWLYQTQLMLFSSDSQCSKCSALSSDTLRNCLGKMGKPRATVLLLGDSTTQGLLQEALGMWSEAQIPHFSCHVESW
jgi:hypothetical protein